MTDDEVKLPEPIGYLYHDSISDDPAAVHPWLHSTMLVLAADRRPTCRNETPLYTDATVRRLIAEAVEREREACAVLCEALRMPAWVETTGDVRDALSDAIRNRSKA